MWKDKDIYEVDFAFLSGANEEKEPCTINLSFKDDADDQTGCPGKTPLGGR